MDRACARLEDKEHNLKRLGQSLNRLTAPSSSPSVVQVVSCLTLLLCTVSATVFAELSKSNDGSYPYNTFVVPCAVEAFKLLVSALTLLVLHARGDSVKVSFSYSNFAMFAIPAFCYFVSNNCMFYIIRELGPTTYQITNNLKVLSTALLMRVFLARKLSWLRWKALLLLVVGSVVAELNGDDGGRVRGSALGYFFVLFSCFASSTGGVLTEKLLKGKSDAREKRFDPLAEYSTVLVWGIVWLVRVFREKHRSFIERHFHWVQLGCVRDDYVANHAGTFCVLRFEVYRQHCQVLRSGGEYALRGVAPHIDARRDDSGSIDR